MDKENRLIKLIKSGDKSSLESVYTLYKKEFLLYSNRFSVSHDDVLDIYQDTIIALHNNIMSGKLETLSCSLKTYLFTIGKYQIYNRLKIKTTSEDVADYEYLLQEENEDAFLLQEENIIALQKAYKELGGKCQEVLRLFYYQNYSLEEIKNNLDYTSKDVVKSQKSRCLKQLKEIILNHKDHDQL